MKLRNVSLFTVLSLSMLLAGCTSKEEEDSSIDSGGVAEDIDGDGYSADGGDCDDGDASVNPGAGESPYDGVDNDCDPSTPDDDLDGDGFVLTEDCDDEDASLGGPEVPYDGVDNDCDPSTPDDDLDGDGLVLADDCDDEDASVGVLEDEVFGDGVDNNCNGATDGGEIDLGGATAKLIEESSQERAGYSVSGAGDVDGDGFDDLLIGAYLDGSAVGAAFLVLGPVSGNVGLSAADAKLIGEDTWDYAGKSVSGAGDVDGDGFDDLLVGAYLEDSGGSNAGAAYLVLGPVSGNVYLSAADAKLIGERSENYAGESVSGAGDVDGDGFDDILIGADGEESGGDHAGAAYLVLGPVSGNVDLFAADAKLIGEDSWNRAGVSVSDARDVDGDGFDDILIGAYAENSGGSNAGAAYLLLGPVSGNVDLSAADAKLIGENSEDYAGVSVSDAGDVDGDGFDDILIGANEEDSGGSSAGAAYLVLGPVSGNVDLSAADAKLIGENSEDRAGGSVSGAGDVDGDGFDDLLIGVDGEDSGGEDAGAAYLVLGPVSGSVDLSTADVKLIGEDSEDYAGVSVSGVGDVDGDGFDDILIGAPYEDSGGSEAGAAYLLTNGAF